LRRTKIVATVGPATNGPRELRLLLEAGADVIRLNLAHADPETHRRVAATARAEAAAVNKEVGLLADLPGPKMRTGTIAGDELILERGQSFTLFGSETEGSPAGISTSVPDLALLVQEGEEIFLADGAIILRVTSVRGGNVHTEVVRRGLLRSRKGMHIPRAESKIQAFTADDDHSLDLAVELQVDFVGLSFVRTAADIQSLRRALAQKRANGGRGPLLVAKIETRSAVEHLDEIVSEADAVMVARGDLGIQIPFRDVPLLQKEIIRACNRTGTPVITATQMLESMTHGPLPSRAEVNDVANAVLDGTDALMLSEETAIGHYPVETVQTMSEIAEAAEAPRPTTPASVEHDEGDDRVSWAMARAAVHAAEELRVAAILCPTRSGSTARRVAAFRPSMPVLGLGHRPETVRPLAVVWGVIPKTAPDLPDELSADEAVPRSVEAARHMGLVRGGNLVAVVAGGPEPRTGSTDFVRIVSA
jgi:pyruvate kinase